MKRRERAKATPSANPRSVKRKAFPMSLVAARMAETCRMIAVGIAPRSIPSPAETAGSKDSVHHP